MSELKCPFCQQELNDNYYLCCNNPHCNKTYDMLGTEELWQELIRTRKALDRAKWWLHEIVESHRCTPISTAEMALEDITALTKGGDNE